MTEVVEADELLLFVSAGPGGFVELDGASELSKARRMIDAGERPTVSALRDMRLSFVGGPDVVALDRVAKIQRNLWSSTELIVVSSYDEL